MLNLTSCPGGLDWEASGSAPAPRFRSTACLVMPRPDDYFLKKSESSKGPQAPTSACPKCHSPHPWQHQSTPDISGPLWALRKLETVSQDLIYLDPGHFREIAEPRRCASESRCRRLNSVKLMLRARSMQGAVQSLTRQESPVSV